VQQVLFDENIAALTYHAESGLYVLGMTRQTPFKLPDDDWHRDWVNEGLYSDYINMIGRNAHFPADITFQPSIDVGVLRLVDPSSWSTIHE